MKTLSLILISFILAGCGRESVPNSGPLPTPSTTAGEGIGTARGTINGGGGVGVRCGNSLEMLDLYEARKSGLTFSSAQASKEAAALMVSDRMSKHFWNVDTVEPEEHAQKLRELLILPIFEGRAFYNAVTKKSEDVNFVESLPLSNDYGNYELPKGCALEQIAFYSDSNTKLSIVRSAWNELDWMSKSVLAVHELIYMIHRRSGLDNLIPESLPKNSESVRKFTGKLLSLESLPTRSSGFSKSQPLYTCDGAMKNNPKENSTIAYAFDSEATGALTLVFNSIHDMDSFYQLRASFKSAKLSDLTDSTRPLTLERAELETTGSGEPTNFSVTLEKSVNGKPLFQLFHVANGKRIQIKDVQSLDCGKFED
ncbi:MAG: hypothetical protein EOP05_12175 [Proteobacteria bacterium]|nr:MAG: hypothetical protein EOP05_12175 [Pseudomonadota bacterium]